MSYEKIERMKKLCEEMGIDWNPDVYRPTLNGRSLSKNDVAAYLLGEIIDISFSAEMDTPVDVTTVDYINGISSDLLMRYNYNQCLVA